MLHLFMKGGPLMWPLLLVSWIALTTVFERVLTAFRENRNRRPGDIRSLLRDLRNGNLPGAVDRGLLNPDFKARCLALALQNKEASFAAAYQQEAARELRRLSRGLPILDTVITLAPLLGLLGTVTGMIHAFGLMGASELEAPTAITGGIAEALIATAFGLIIASMSLVPFNWLNARVEKAQHELQDLGSQAEPLVAALDPDQTRAISKTAAERYASARS